MLRTALIGFPATGKTTLFHLMTGHHDSARSGGHGKVEAAVGVAKVPDPRLDRLTDLFRPRRRVPATVEFADLAGAGHASTQALLDVAPFRDADALVHVVRAFRDEAVPHHAPVIDTAADAQAMEDELILADLGVAERRLERVERDLKKIKDRAVLRRIAGAIDGLAANPRPPGAKALRGDSSILRIRIGDYRIFYTVEDAVLLVLVVRIGHRRDVYRGGGKMR